MNYMLTDKFGLTMLANTIQQSSRSTTTQKKTIFPSYMFANTISNIFDDQLIANTFSKIIRLSCLKYVVEKIPNYMLTYKFDLIMLAKTIQQSSLSTTTSPQKQCHPFFKPQTCVDQNLGGPWP